MDSIYPETDTDKLGNWVQWTRFPYMETEFIELDFHVSYSVFVQTLNPCFTLHKTEHNHKASEY